MIRKLKTISFEISEDDFQVLDAIATRFYKGCFRGNRPMDVRELALSALMAQKKDMAWVLEPSASASNVVRGPWSFNA